MSNERNFKMTMSCYEKTVTFEVDHADISIEDAIHGFVTCLRGLTWYEDTINHGLLNYLEEYTNLLDNEVS